MPYKVDVIGNRIDRALWKKTENMALNKPFLARFMVVPIFTKNLARTALREPCLLVEDVALAIIYTLKTIKMLNHADAPGFKKAGLHLCYAVARIPLAPFKVLIFCADNAVCCVQIIVSPLRTARMYRAEVKIEILLEQNYNEFQKVCAREFYEKFKKLVKQAAYDDLKTQVRGIFKNTTKRQFELILGKKSLKHLEITSQRDVELRSRPRERRQVEVQFRAITLKNLIDAQENQIDTIKFTYDPTLRV